jgi:IS5 family transposase
MKAHIGVDSRTKLIHSVAATAANVHDRQVLPSCCMDRRLAYGTTRACSRMKSKVRAKVEYVFLVSKRIFGWPKVRYRGLAKNTHWAVHQLRVGESVRGSTASCLR